MMTPKKTKFINTRPLLGMLLLALVLLGLMFVSCAKNLSGDLKVNSKPAVQFVNIPPDGQQFSRNPIVYWYGTDVDGVIAFYRYHVATVSALGAQTPEQYIAAADSSAWTYLEVDPTGVNNQQTQVSISLVADSLDPVITFVSQYVFIQAYDNEGQSSDVEYRLFSRNDNPPQTLLFGSLTGSKDAPYVNAVTAGGIITGIRLNWQGSDPIDYPSDPPPFEFEWKLFGPFTDAEATQLHAQFVVKKFVTREGKVFDLGDTLFCCNEDSSDCDTIIVATTNAGIIAACFGADYGVFDSTFLASDPTFLANPAWNKLAASSFDGADNWVTKTADTIYNVFANSAGPTTTQRQFIFWLRSRDDARVPDLVPAFRFVHVIDPRYERDVIIIDLTFRTNSLYNTSGTALNSPIPKQYFLQAMKAWDPATEFDTLFDTLNGIVDYATIGDNPSLLDRRIPMAWLLSHKVMIIMNDNIAPANLDSKASFYSPIFTAIDGGVNAWVMARCPLSLGSPTGPTEATQLIITPRVSGYTSYFGVVGMAYSGWFCHAASTCTRARIEDFIGGISLLVGDPGWPDVSVDSAKLANPNIIKWGPGPLGYQGNPGLPEVNWSQRLTPGTEGLFLYKSAYGNQHPLGGPYSYQGAPCAHRFNTGLYRTIHFNFTPIVMDSASMQTVFNSGMDWLIEGGNQSPTARVRYEDAPIRMSKEVARENYKRRIAEEEQQYLLDHPELEVNFR